MAGGIIAVSTGRRDQARCSTVSRQLAGCRLAPMPSGVSKAAPVPTEHELVEAAAQMRAPQAVESAERPAFQVREDAMGPLEHEMGVRVAGYSGLVVMPGQAGIPGQLPILLLLALMITVSANISRAEEETMKTLYLANPYGFSVQQREGPLRELALALQSIGADVWEPFERNNQDTAAAGWAYRVGQADMRDVREADGFFGVVNGCPPDEQWHFLKDSALFP